MSKPVWCCFHKVVEKTLNRDLMHKGTLENQGKAIVRGCLKNVVFKSSHFASFFKRENVIPSVLPSGRPCWSKVEIKENYRFETVFLNHYMTKSLSEFINQKLNRNDAVYNQNLKLDYYWRINKKTKEKELVSFSERCDDIDECCSYSYSCKHISASYALPKTKERKNAIIKAYKDDKKCYFCGCKEEDEYDV